MSLGNLFIVILPTFIFKNLIEVKTSLDSLSKNVVGIELDLELIYLYFPPSFHVTVVCYFK